ncbi:MAG: aspartyl-phosphate phosphatase Spo0E family protein [Thermotaleaceae bacterium]
MTKEKIENLKEKLKIALNSNDSKILTFPHIVALSQELDQYIVKEQKRLFEESEKSERKVI